MGSWEPGLLGSILSSGRRVRRGGKPSGLEPGEEAPSVTGSISISAPSTLCPCSQIFLSHPGGHDLVPPLS